MSTFSAVDGAVLTGTRGVKSSAAESRRNYAPRPFGQFPGRLSRNIPARSVSVSNGGCGDAHPFRASRGRCSETQSRRRQSQRSSLRNDPAGSILSANLASLVLPRQLILAPFN